MATNIQKGVIWIAICTPLVAAWEGLFLHAYHDKLAYGLVTVCYGMTKAEDPDISITDVYTKEECQQFLADALPRYYAGIAKCIRVDLPSIRRRQRSVWPTMWASGQSARAPLSASLMKVIQRLATISSGIAWLQVI